MILANGNAIVEDGGERRDIGDCYGKPRDRCYGPLMPRELTRDGRILTMSENNAMSYVPSPGVLPVICSSRTQTPPE